MIGQHVYPKIYDLSVLHDRDKKNSDKLWQFYIDSGFVYEDKLKFLAPIQGEILDTMEKLLHCQDNTCEYLFVAHEDKLVGSVVAVRYTDKAWIVQHIVVLPEYRLSGLAKELILGINSWMIKNREMHYFVNYFREKTRWAYKTYFGIMNQIEDKKYMEIENYEYLVFEEIGGLNWGNVNSAISVERLDEADYSEIYRLLTRDRKEVTINALGLEPDNYSIEKARLSYNKLGLRRDRIYLTAKYDGRIVGFALLDISSYGISLSLLFNCFHFFVFDENLKLPIVNALINEIRTIYERHGKKYLIGIIEPKYSSVLMEMGFTCRRTYLRYSFSRDNNQFFKTFDIVNAGSRGIRG